MLEEFFDIFKCTSWVTSGLARVYSYLAEFRSQGINSTWYLSSHSKPWGSLSISGRSLAITDRVFNWDDYVLKCNFHTLLSNPMTKFCPEPSYCFRFIMWHIEWWISLGLQMLYASELALNPLQRLVEKIRVWLKSFGAFIRDLWG